MLRFACTYRDAIDKLTGERALKLRDYEVGEDEWEMVRQLRNILKVSFYYNWPNSAYLTNSRVLNL